MLPKAPLEHILTTSRIRENKSLLTCFWYVCSKCINYIAHGIPVPIIG
jgi:hypothetical protein